MDWTCTLCGDVHEGVPLSFAWDEPAHWNWIPEEERPDRGVCTEDFCRMVDDDGEIAYFVRGTLELPILDAPGPGEEAFVFGVWTSLSRASFERLLELGDRTGEDGEGFFGWLCNRLPGYPDTVGVPTDVLVRGEIRPLIVPQRGDHPLQHEQHEGITIERARELSALTLHPA